MIPLGSPKKKTRRVAALRVFLCCAALFYFLRPFSHLQIVSNIKFETIPATTEIRNEIAIDKSPTRFTSFPQLSGQERQQKYFIIYSENCQ